MNLTERNGEQLARAVEQFIQMRDPGHTAPDCKVRGTANEDWIAAGCEFMCSLCILNRALAIYRKRA